MAFAVEDFQDLMALLRANPEWLAELRHLLIDEFWEPLRKDVERLANLVEAGRIESDRRWQENEKRWEENDRQWEANEKRWDANDRQWQANEKRWDANDRQWQANERRWEVNDKHWEAAWQRFDRIDARLGHVEGMSLETQIRATAPGIFGRVLRRGRVVQAGNLDAVLDAADQGLLTDAQWEQLMRLDVLLSGRRGDAEVLIAIEVSSTIDEHDVSRVLERAGLLQTVGYETMAAVVGRTITDEAQEQAASNDVFVRLVA
jgi:hypothetical protein